VGSVSEGSNEICEGMTGNLLSGSKNKNFVTAIIGVGILFYILTLCHGKGDWFIFLSASEDIFKGEDIYNKHYVDGYHYMYSIFFGILLKPLTLLPLQVSRFIWLSFNVLFLWRSFKICLSFFSLENFSDRQKLFFVLIPLVFCLRFVLDNFNTGQLTTLMLYLSLEGTHQVFNRGKWYGAIFIALGINIKLFPLVLIPLLLYRKKIIETLLVIFFTLLFYFLPVVFIGWEQNAFLMKQWWLLINPSNTQHVLDVEERSFHGLSTLLSTLLVSHDKVQQFDIYQLPLKRNIADVDLKTLGIILNGARLLLVGFTIFFLRSFPFKHPKNKTHSFFELSYILMIVPLIFPHQQGYAFLFVLPAIFCICFYLLSDPLFFKSVKGKIVLTLFSLCYLLCNLKLLLGVFVDYYDHFKILTYGAIILIPLLAVIFNRYFFGEKERK
jgi:hypothetical protein